MPIVEPDDEAFVGIIPRAPNWTQRAIERRGPPPGNAETLIRGGASWVFGITPREEPVQEAIVREKREAPIVALLSESPREPPIRAATRPFPRSRGKGLDDCPRRRQLRKRRESKRFDEHFIASKPLPLERGKGRSSLAQQAAFYMRYVLQYAAWWDVEGGNRFPDRSAARQEDKGIGIPMFLSMKKLTAAIRTVSAQQIPKAGARPDLDFEGFMRHA